ncbi:unnamed protein product [Didymodactylos carnosus]|uniref:Mitochondrial pyruvate carrier n=1 Tax=Didymodactylos carnosus TaxID=1234261 RepID=A0A814LAK9_9BILA|nr:unnamed protein product [Didymodactylos carnosus]CAF1061690.1 unnamed protein product [Didymodactylos carnosus]CAF3692642.1 unnamed protein product [Didymodactylos carnosus]CAF3829861.1 unnamed protein product [Didymodactylos carnosus]
MKYIHFWAPVMKWSLVGAGFGDSTIWSRYSMVIIPKNYMLFAVNIFLSFVGGQQLARIAYYRYTHPEEPKKN